MDKTFVSRLTGATLFTFGTAMLALVSISAPVRAQDQSTIDLVAVDPVTDGNEATALGELDGCAEADVGSEIMVDVVVDAVPEDRPIIGFQLELLYDADLLEVTAADYDFLMAAEGSFQPIDGLSDELPDSDGEFRIVVADVASNVETDENMESGTGVLSRITLRTLAEGTSDVAIKFDPPDSYPAVVAPDNLATQVDNLGAATVSVDEACPADADPQIMPLPSLEELQPTPGPTIDPASIPDPEGGGIDYTLLAVAIALGSGGLIAIGSGWLFYRRVSSA